MAQELIFKDDYIKSIHKRVDILTDLGIITWPKVWKRPYCFRFSIEDEKIKVNLKDLPKFDRIIKSTIEISKIYPTQVIASTYDLEQFQINNIKKVRLLWKWFRSFNWSIKDWGVQR